MLEGEHARSAKSEEGVDCESGETQDGRDENAGRSGLRGLVGPRESTSVRGHAGSKGHASPENRLSPLSFVLMGGHICVDTAQGGLAAVLPFLVAQGGYTYAQVTMLVLASNVASAVIQPLFGWLGDKTPRPWIMAAGVFLAGLGMAGIGVLGSYEMLALSALVSGVGIAMLHPEGGRLANLAGGSRKAESMSVFSVGGQIGFCVGPLVTVAAVSALGLAGMLVYLVFCVPYSLLLLALCPTFKRCGAVGESMPTRKTAQSSDRWGAFTLVLSVLSVRSIVFYGVTSFVPLFLVSVFGQTEQMGSLVISAYSLMAAVATLLSGRMVRYVETTRLASVCMVALSLLLLTFALSPVMAVSVAAVLLAAFALNLYNAPLITLGQDFVPHHLGMASGLSFGVVVAVGGVVSPVLGALGDAVGLVPVIGVLAALAGCGFILTLLVRRVA